MSKDNVKNMFAKFEKDADLKKKYTEIMKIHRKETEDALADMLIELGRNSGFDFSKNDLISVRTEFIDRMNSNSELSDADLNQVAGGGEMKTKVVIISVVSAGAICAMLSVFSLLETSNFKNSGYVGHTKCAHALTVTEGCKTANI